MGRCGFMCECSWYMSYTSLKKMAWSWYQCPAVFKMCFCTIKELRSLSRSFWSQHCDLWEKATSWWSCHDPVVLPLSSSPSFQDLANQFCYHKIRMNAYWCRWYTCYGWVQGGEFWKGCEVVGAVPAGGLCSVKHGRVGTQWKFSNVCSTEVNRKAWALVSLLG